ncbi:AraC family transcriptional regulator [Zavarzinia compransoris]|uniref:AraC family transcriptional regulator n=1 Tax=Zavarzinia marina TaxID=2911065 RepID=UPI001F25EAED|nr:AraC family transcriptional regulator [Zavarzinia marina]MCF4165724.1 AraC family transcriptional regulator [Zavarzinia marina]
MIGSGVSTAYVRTVIETAAGLVPGLAPGDVLARAGVDPARLSRADGQLTLGEVDRIWQAAAALAATPALGLAVGRQAQPASFSLVGQVMMTAPDLGTALREAVRLTPLIGEGGLIEIGHEPGRVLMRYTPASADWVLKEMRVDAALGASLMLARMITGHDLSPVEVRLERSAPRDAGPWATLFGTKVRFGAGQNALVWNRDQMAMPLRAANEAVNRLLLAHAEDVCRERLSGGGMPAALRRVLQGLLAAEKGPSVEAAADALNTSVRSLQRALDAAGTTFSAERDAVRLALARRYLSRPDLKVEAVAARLGFAEAGVFVRAFRRWTGQTPARWRRVTLGESGLSGSPSSASSSGAADPGTDPRP